MRSKKKNRSRPTKSSMMCGAHEIGSGKNYTAHLFMFIVLVDAVVGFSPSTSSLFLYTIHFPLFCFRCCDFVGAVSLSKKGNNLPNKCFIVTYLPKILKENRKRSTNKENNGTNRLCKFFSSRSLLFVRYLGSSFFCLYVCVCAWSC